MKCWFFKKKFRFFSYYYLALFLFIPAYKMKKSIRPFCFRDLCKIPNIFQRSVSLIQIKVFFSVFETLFQILHFYNILKNGLDNLETHSTEYSIKKETDMFTIYKIQKLFKFYYVYLLCVYFIQLYEMRCFCFRDFFSNIF